MSQLIHIFPNEPSHGDFTMRVVGTGDRYGKDWALTHEREDPLIEFYDRRFAFEDDPADGRCLGQFVARYALPTLLEEGADGRNAFDWPLALDAGIPAWTVSREGMWSCRQALANAGLTFHAPSERDAQVAIVMREGEGSLVVADTTDDLDAKIMELIQTMTGKTVPGMVVRDGIRRLCIEEGIQVQRATAEPHCAEGFPVTHAAILTHGSHRTGLVATSESSLVIPIRDFIEEVGYEDPREEHLCLVASDLYGIDGMTGAIATRETILHEFGAKRPGFVPEWEDGDVIPTP